MKSPPLASFVLVLSLAFAGCQSTQAAPCPDVQAAVVDIARRHAEIVRLSVHAVPPGGSAVCAIASTSEAKLGKPSDPEDERALANGGLVVLREPGAIDVTVPLQKKDGRFHAVAGVTVKGTDDRAAIALAQAVAAELEVVMAARAQSPR